MPPASLIVDVTYRCNARCSYCRWGDGRTSERRDPAVADLCVAPELLRAASVWRVVLSGGEPLLHPQLADVLAHYTAADVRCPVNQPRRSEWVDRVTFVRSEQVAWNLGRFAGQRTPARA